MSPAWHAWVAAGPTLELLAELGAPALHAHSLGLADRFRTGLDLPPGDSAIVSLEVDDGAAAALQSASVIGSMRAGRLRLSFHLSTSEDDVDVAVDALRGRVRA